MRAEHAAELVEPAAEWNKAERLAVAAAVAPSLRSQSDKVKARRVTLIDKSGKVTGHTTLGEVQKALLRERAIEIEVADGVRPREVVCQACGKPVKAPPGPGPLPKVCRDSDGGCARQRTCGVNGCKAKPPRGAFAPARVRDREGGAWRCVSHALTPEQRAERARKANAALTPEQRSENARKATAALTPEQRLENMRKARAALTPEQRSENARKARAALTPEQRSENMRKMNAALTPEQRSESARKANATRREKKAEAAKQVSA